MNRLDISDTQMKALASESLRERSASPAAQELLSFFENRRPENFKEEVNLALELRLNPAHRVSAQLSFKIGRDRLYVVRDIGNLLRALEEEKTLDFGKEFSFEPQHHIFKEEDRPLIDLLREIHAVHLEASRDYYAVSSILADKHLFVKGVYLKKLLNVLGNKTFSLSVGPLPAHEVRILRERLPLKFSLHAHDQDMDFSLEADELPLPLTGDGSYYLYRQEIYQVSPEQEKVLPPVLGAFGKEARFTLLLPTEKKEFFVSEVLPALEKAGEVAIDPDLAAKFSREDLLTQVYFERGVGNGVSARVEFHYGSTVINPFAAHGNSSKGGDGGEMILVRAAEQEEQVLGILEQADFSVSQGRIHLEDDQKIFELATNYLPQLQGLAEIYYSEDFRFTLRSSVSFSGRIRLDETLNLLEVSFQYRDIAEDELIDVFQALQRKKKYFRLRDGSFLQLNQPELEDVARLLDQLDLQAEDLRKKVLHLPKYRALYIDNYLRQSGLQGIARNKAFKQLVQSILEPQDSEFEVPLGLEHVLRDYQKTGFKWLKTLASYGLGGILADDMGLGKTLQVLAFLLAEKESTTNPSLVIVPTSLVYNWLQEAERFAPELKVLIVEGTPKERQAQLLDISGWDLVVTSYPVLRRDIEYYASLEFSYCFLDEAQHIKNPETVNAKSVQQIQAKGYFALTGTPIENALSELWSIFNFIMPGYLQTQAEFSRKYEVSGLQGEGSGPIRELSRHVTPFILRRLKKNVLLELPDKIETRLTAQMTEEQKKIYLAFLLDAKRNIASEIASVGFERSRIKILAVLTRLRQICCHPGMFLEDYAGESGKMLLFQEILADALDSGHRILVFSQFTSMLDIIQKYLSGEGIGHFYLRGSTKGSDRALMVQSFNAGEGDIFLISLKAGGTGLNLTGADMVIHFDPWWNPAVEDQATDRAYRIGQEKAVQVIKLVTQGTIEEKVYALQAKKKELIEAVIRPGETFVSKLTEEELKGIFDML